MNPKHLRNVCIIAHVDHGKTTLVDHLLRQAGTFQKHQHAAERVMDSMDLERERGITILAKNTSIRLGDTKINIVDTPGHADFGGEVERIMGMVDGAILLVDAAEGALPQTRFVLQKALRTGLRVVLVVNKVDRPEAKDGKRIQYVVDQIFDLFCELGAQDWQLDFPILYACGREGWCTTEESEIPKFIDNSIEPEKKTLKPLFDALLSQVPEPKIVDSPDFQMVVSNLSYSEYVGRLAIGRILSGKIQRNQRLFLKSIDAQGAPTQQSFNAVRLYTFEGLQQVEVQELVAGDIGVVSGNEFFEIGDTVASSDAVAPLPRISVEKPTLGMIFSVNTSPLSGQEGEAIQSRKLRDRLLREVRNNVALRFEETKQSDQFRVLGRGELQFAILIEQMRREGFEFMVGKPEVLFGTDEDGQKTEPLEKAVLDLPEQYASEVTQAFQQRKGILMHFSPSGDSGRVRLEIEIPTRGLLGMRSRYLTITRGAGLFSTEFLGYAPHKGEIIHRVNGSLVADRAGETIEYALLTIEERGVLFVGPGVKIYEGMIIGEHAKDTDLNVNACREKKLTNIRAAHAEFLVTLSGIRKMSLEQCLEWIDEDEWIEITPESIRIRKKVLPANLRSVKRRES